MSDGKIINMCVSVMTIVMLFVSNGNACFADTVDPHQLINSSIDRFKHVSDYTCKLDKRVNKNGIIYEELAIYVKYKKPKHYYFRWEQGEAKGQEVIFVAGKYGDKIVAHSGGLFRIFTLHLDPEGKIAMRKNRHSLKDSGLEKVMRLIELNYKHAREAGLGSITYAGEDRIAGRDVFVIEGSFPEKQGFYAHEITVSLDKELLLPIRVSVFDWSKALLEEYMFRELRINSGFNEFDFDPDNPEYNF